MTIAVIDDDDAVLHSLRLLLESRGMVVRCYSSAEAFLADLEDHTPTCVVSDVRMPGLTGLDLQRELNRRRSSLPLVLVTGHGDIATAVAAIKDGAADFIEKPFDEEHLVASISRAASSGERLRSEQNQWSELAARVRELSPRQHEVMDLVVDGLSNKEIALRLGISPRTVENYRAWVMEKMGAVGLADLVRKVLLLKAGEENAAGRRDRRPD
jgi:two-component system response regulator FixJ